MNSVVGLLYSGNDYKPLWSRHENWLPEADSLYSFIEHSKEYGLFPNDYHLRALQKIRSLVSTDTDCGQRRSFMVKRRVDIQRRLVSYGQTS
jgi:hypothetical protein